MKLKISGNKHGLCSSCKFAFIRETERDGVVVYCHNYAFAEAQLLPNRVTSCNKYVNADHPSLTEMHDIAWTVEPATEGRVFGFQPPKKKRDEDY